MAQGGITHSHPFAILHFFCEDISMPSARCTYSASDGRRCTSLTYPGHSFLCHQHLRKELDFAPPSEDVATDLLSSIQNFQSAAAINAALGKIFALLAAGRIKRQEAIAMAYICQLMLQSLKELKQEISETTYEDTRTKDVCHVLAARIPLEEFVFPPELEDDDPVESPGTTESAQSTQTAPPAELNAPSESPAPDSSEPGSSEPAAPDLVATSVASQ